MKKKWAIVMALVLPAVCCGLLWWNMPVTFLKDVSPKEIAGIYVFDGTTGQSFLVEEPENIEYILANIQKHPVKKAKISAGYKGTMFQLTFLGMQGETIDAFSIDHDTTIRKDPFYYRDKTGSLCADYLKVLEKMASLKNGGKEAGA